MVYVRARPALSPTERPADRRTQACLTLFSHRLACGLANFGIAHWPSFLRRTAPHRRDHRRREYGACARSLVRVCAGADCAPYRNLPVSPSAGDERTPNGLALLERLSPLNAAASIAVPLSIAHGAADSRVTVDEALEMFAAVRAAGVHAELMVCDGEGHGAQFFYISISLGSFFSRVDESVAEGFKQKSVIEFTNAAKIRFLERFLLGRE
jgi:pimeloyl-ACP methyl ester carboxylesterase